MFFKCAVCAEKDKRVSDLQAQIDYLKSFITANNNPEYTPTIQLEADGVLSAQQHVIDVPMTSEEYELKQAEETQRERDRLLSGTYN